MRRVLGGVAAAVLALTAVPALAADEEVPAEPALNTACTTVPAGATLLTPAGFTGTITTPSAFAGNEREDAVFVLDLTGSPVGTTAGLTATTSWLVPANDYDLEVLAGKASGASENYQPVDPAEESVSANGLAHCQKVTVTAIDFLAPVVVDTIDLGVVVTPKLPA